MFSPVWPIFKVRPREEQEEQEEEAWLAASQTWPAGTAAGQTVSASGWILL